MSRVKVCDQSATHINLKVKCQDGNEVLFRIKRSTRLKKLMNAYCRAQSVEINSIAFLFDGRLLHAEQTPDELELTDGDVINTMPHQTGVLESNLESATFSGMLRAIETLKSAKNDIGRQILELEAQLCNLKHGNDLDSRASGLEAQLRNRKIEKKDMDSRISDFKAQLSSVFSKLKKTSSRMIHVPNLDYLPAMSNLSLPRRVPTPLLPVWGNFKKKMGMGKEKV